jgi:uncharacterized protein (DUF305 family)
MKQLFAMLGACVLLGTSALADAPAPSPATAHFEVKFMTDMIDHHAMAIMMAESCVEKAVHPELRSLCQNIIAAQSQEIEQMQSWLQSWYRISYEPEMDKTNGQMKKLMSMSGAMFEIEFMQMMIRHHAKAVDEGEKCLQKAYHPELRQLCQNIIVTQTAEIQQMQSWLCQWYQICNWGPKA